MENEKACFTCHSCGKKTGCFPGELPCEVLKNWITVSHWKGPGAVDHYHFCSFSCLKSWVGTQLPEVPEVFLESFRENESQQDKE